MTARQAAARTAWLPFNAPNRDKQDLDEREVTIAKDFWMGVTEVTQAQYEAVMGENPSRSGKVSVHPVDGVSFNQAVAFCKKVSEKTGKTVRMPTEAEWEYAARAGGDGVGKAKITDVAWCMENSEKKRIRSGPGLPTPGVCTTCSATPWNGFRARSGSATAEVLGRPPEPSVCRRTARDMGTYTTIPTAAFV
jgi:hypothetical protein